MTTRVLITGGAGFIGTHVASELLGAGWQVRALDTLDPQVHGEGARRPAALDPRVELIEGDVRDPAAVGRALDGVDAVVHLAALVGVGQSMYQVADYTSVNTFGTAVLLEALIERPVKRVVVASSMSIYGEGRYRGQGEGRISGCDSPCERTRAQLQSGDWEVRDAGGQPLDPEPTPEDKPPGVASVYALSKYDQERLCLVTARAYGMEAVALRLFNVYGPHQALSNPYTGVLAIFAARLLNGNPPLIFEDGRQRRDFVSVRDVARAFRLALEAPGADGHVLNIGSGQSHTVLEVAELLAEVLGRRELRPVLTGQYRVGDIRHCFADIRAARRVLGYQPAVMLRDGLTELGAWLERQIAVDRVEAARAELEARGLTL